MVKLIDVHRHLWGFEWFPPSHLRNNAEALAKKTGRTTEQVLERIAQSPTMDATGQIAIDEMEHYGEIKNTVVGQYNSIGKVDEKGVPNPMG